MEDSIVIGGNEIHFKISGNESAGDTVVFVHGIGTASFIWNEVIERLAPDYRLVVFDWKCSGKSRINVDNTPFDVESLAKELGAILDKLNVKEPYIIAHGAGALVSLQADIDERVNAKGIMAINAADVYNVKPKLKAFSKIMTEKTPRMHVKYVSAIKDQLNDSRSSFVEAWLREFKNVDLSRDSPYINTPVDFVLGKDNDFVREKDVEAAVSRIPNSKMMIIDAKNFPMLEAPDEVSAEFHEFVTTYIPSL